MVSEATSELAARNVQGNILTAFPNVDHACLIMVQCRDAEALRSLLESAAALAWPTTQLAAGRSSGDALCANLGFTYEALERSGLVREALMHFPKEFREGMRARAGLLGDIGANHPDHWRELEVNWPRPQPRTIPLSCVDTVITLQSASEATDPLDEHAWGNDHPLYGEVKRFEGELERRSVASSRPLILRVEPLRRRPTDHFRLRDEERDAAASLAALGELLLGYPDRRGKVAEATRADFQHARLFQDSTFLVLRKLEQDVPAFEAYIEEVAAKLAIQVERVRALMAEGERLALATQQGPTMVLRNISYGAPREPGASDDAAERGMMFLAFNANIAQQFEVAQRWFAGGNVSPTCLADDILFGVHRGRAGAYPVVIDGKPRSLDAPDKSFVTLRWGMYLFVPSRRAIRDILDATLHAGRAPDR